MRMGRCIYLYTTNSKGIRHVSAPSIWQEAAWLLLHRPRRASEKGRVLFPGPGEADERYLGGKGKNMSNEQCKD